jgi:enamine deaminase RidA (YjgF/YER057c/UK114 family)
MLIRKIIASGYPFEDAYGYARAVRVGDSVFVSGTTARSPFLDGDACLQMTGAIQIIAAALQEAGAELRHVVRTVVYVVDMADADHVARAHREAFGDARPANTLVQVAALTPANALVEVEVTAIVHDGSNAAVNSHGKS